MTKVKKAFCWILDTLAWVWFWVNLPVLAVLVAIAYVVKPLKHFCIDLIKSRLIFIAALNAFSHRLWYGPDSDFSDSYNGFMYNVTNEIYDILEKETEA